MSFTRRAVLVGTAACALGASSADPDGALFATLDAVGPFLGNVFHPGRAIAAIQALLALPPVPRQAALRRYLAVRPNPPEGLFAVLRALVEPPAVTQAPEPFPGVLQPGFLRPPALGAPHPEQPTDLAGVPHWPVVMLDDVPLVAVSGYSLAGEAEPLSMHLDGLAHARWRTTPLVPGSAGSVRYQLIHWGRWSADPATTALFESQLTRLEKG